MKNPKKSKFLKYIKYIKNDINILLCINFFINITNSYLILTN